MGGLLPAPLYPYPPTSRRLPEIFLDTTRTHRHTHRKHHAPHVFHAPEPSAYCLAAPEPPSSSLDHQGRSPVRQGQLRPCHPSQSGGAFGPDLAKKLAQLVKMEKNVMRSMENVAKERMEVAQQLSVWGEGGDEDVSDVTDKLGVLLYEIGE